jgi:hypothetical protein
LFNHEPKKFCPCRFFRLWALLDGVELPENMGRCMSNNFTLSGFWRNWHCSFNRWCVRYIYVPLGGRAHRLRNVFAVFTFVALWHDMTFQLLAWGWISALAFAPEGLATTFARSNRAAGLRSRWWFHNLTAAAGALNIRAAPLRPSAPLMLLLRSTPVRRSAASRRQPCGLRRRTRRCRWVIGGRRGVSERERVHVGSESIPHGSRVSSAPM